jgi:simple sugar transport system ATP-binding protein
MNWGTVYTESRELTKQFDIRTPSIFTKIRSLSGGNQQKVIVARELYKKPSVILAGQPTRGLDVGVIEYVHRRLIEMRDEGKGVLLVSSDLDELLTLSDRIAVMYEGEIISYEDPQNTTEQRLGLLMAGHVDKINTIN